MFANELKIMLYVTNVEEASRFWQKIGFTEVEREAVDGTVVVEVAAHEMAEARLVLYDRAFVAQHSPEVALANPSIMFTSKNIAALYHQLKVAQVTVGELMRLPSGQVVFNFADHEENYFAVSGE